MFSHVVTYSAESCGVGELYAIPMPSEFYATGEVSTKQLAFVYMKRNGHYTVTNHQSPEL